MRAEHHSRIKSAFVSFLSSICIIACAFMTSIIFIVGCWILKSLLDGMFG
nr:MAG TPA: hypothetical protein [Caudoviricetes sp.]DAW55310.1 MAG TPA: hypothetical protein [Caudoviricetes sp.]